MIISILYEVDVLWTIIQLLSPVYLQIWRNSIFYSIQKSSSFISELLKIYQKPKANFVFQMAYHIFLLKKGL